MTRDDSNTTGGRRRRGPARAALLIVIAAGFTAGACGFLEDRFKTCEDTPVDLVNSDQTRAPVHILGPAESATNETLLQSGQERRIFQCLQKGEVKRFRAQALNDTQPVATANCVASQASYEAARPRVVWTQVGLRCEGW